ncbi:MAG TPA: hypothetical protein VFL34_08130 [Candidatus Sulfotelmatobacter sp.]|nr:hypothetical protein [Candidatus Sulfotelmatobacter sp.]
MNKLKIISVLLVLVLVVSIGWQFAACELADYELQDDLKDVGSLLGTRIGLTDVRSDDDLRQVVIRKAGEHGIVLAPSQVTVERSGSTETPVIYIKADYRQRVVLLGKSFFLHFTPANRSNRF